MGQLFTQIEEHITQLFTETISKNHQRTKRGLINFLGSAAEAITGNVDSEDGQRYETLISQIQTEQNKQKILLDGTNLPNHHSNRKIQQKHRQINDRSTNIQKEDHRNRINYQSNYFHENRNLPTSTSAQSFSPNDHLEKNLPIFLIFLAI